MQAIQIEAFGNPAEVMKLVDIPDVGAPGEGEVVIALEASPINMSDLLMISGRYGYRPQLPSVMGTEGVGRVIAVGSSVRHLKQGDRIPRRRGRNGSGWMRAGFGRCRTAMSISSPCSASIRQPHICC
jgi:NADPH:quinone reductase-like Zn-dependent oxidoreductase